HDKNHGLHPFAEGVFRFHWHGGYPRFGNGAGRGHARRGSRLGRGGGRRMRVMVFCHDGSVKGMGASLTNYRFTAPARGCPGVPIFPLAPPARGVGGEGTCRREGSEKPGYFPTVRPSPSIPLPGGAREAGIAPRARSLPGAISLIRLEHGQESL